MWQMINRKRTLKPCMQCLGVLYIIACSSITTDAIRALPNSTATPIVNISWFYCGQEGA